MTVDPADTLFCLAPVPIHSFSFTFELFRFNSSPFPKPHFRRSGSEVSRHSFLQKSFQSNAQLQLRPACTGVVEISLHKSVFDHLFVATK